MSPEIFNLKEEIKYLKNTIDELIKYIQYLSRIGENKDE